MAKWGSGADSDLPLSVVKLFTLLTYPWSIYKWSMVQLWEMMKVGEGKFE